MPSANAISALAAYKQRRRYEQVMGDRQPNASDKQFVLELSARLDNYYLAGQQAKEKQLAEAEKKRERRLMEDGSVRTRTQKLPGGRRTLGRSRSRRRRDPAADLGHSKEIWPSNSDETEASLPAGRSQQRSRATAAPTTDVSAEAEIIGNVKDDDQLSCNLTIDQLYLRALDATGRRT